MSSILRRTYWPNKTVAKNARVAREVLRALVDSGSGELPTHEKAVTDAIAGRLQHDRVMPVAFGASQVERFLERFGEEDVNFFDEYGRWSFIQLRPVSKRDRLLPFLSLAADAGLTRFQLFLLVVTEEKDAQGTVVGLRSLGFRFEGPEGGGERGRHNYWHVQLTSSFAQSGGSRHPKTPTWLPRSTPAIPLNANDASTCVAGLAAALYGAVDAVTLVHQIGKRISKKDRDRLISDVQALSRNQVPES